MKRILGMILATAGLTGAVGAATNSSVWAFQGSSGRIIRRPDTLGNRVLDYSGVGYKGGTCLLYTSPSPRDGLLSRMPSSA